MSAVGKLLILSGTLWLLAIALIIYVWIMHARQQAILRYIAGRLTKIEQILSPKKPTPTANKTGDEPTPKTVITINKNEPLSKYEKVTLPDNIDINFVD